MATGPKHYTLAEEHLAYAAATSTLDEGWWPDSVRYHLTVAEVHAALAQVAATIDVVDGRARANWRQVIDGSTS